ncbi:MAG: tetratricopeptide repeat protein [Hyphomicrobiales bacterium]|nr:tetratricopeptide repeat protein [Hyphomicrobiales bacterium]MCP4997729.1 tetratricopeptide repeat protein [Hyphomicrobiales bacterium]
MALEREERRLAAILAADMVEYSRLMEADERGTIARQKAHRNELIDPTIAEHNGRIVKTTGDGLLVEFASAVDATECAVAIQRAMAGREKDVPEASRIRYRVGINLGDIVIDDDDILGDGVNVASRLEEMSDAGGICISGNVHEQIAGKLDVDYTDLGEQPVKNLVRPVRVYRAKLEGLDDVVGGAEVHVAPGLDLSDKPSIAVLAFENLSDDPGQEYFSDGITEDIITALSKFHWFFVIARNSSFTYKGGAVDAKRIARELGVRYILEGSVRRVGNRVRISAQLIDAEADHHLWAERYDRELEDIFEVQDEITQRIVSTVGPELVSAETQRAHRKNSEELGTWDCVMRASWHLYHFERKHNAEARSLLNKAVKIDPNSAIAFGQLAMSHLIEVGLGWAEVPAKNLAVASRAAKAALALDNRDAYAIGLMGVVERNQGRFEDAYASFEKALELNPNLAMAFGAFGSALALGGESERAIVQLKQAIRLSPHDPMIPTWFAYLAFAEFVSNRYGDAIQWARRAVKQRPDFAGGYRVLAASCAHQGELSQARTAVRKLLAAAPHSTLGYVRKLRIFKNQADMDRYLDGLRKAGLPE